MTYQFWHFRRMATDMPAKTVKVPAHGTRYRYVTFGCRCKRCKRANAAYQAEHVKEMRRVKDVRMADRAAKAAADSMMPREPFR